MIAERSARLAGVIVSLSLAMACRDVPLEPPTAPEAAPPAELVKGDSMSQWPDPVILNPYTIIGFAEQGGHFLAEYRVGMEYQGNKATMHTRYAITGDGVSLQDRITSEHDGFYNPALFKSFDRVHYVEVPRNCGLELSGETQHQALWIVYNRLLPNGHSKSVTVVSFGKPHSLKPCPPEEEEPGEGEPERTNTTTTTSGGGTVTVTSCWYWAYYENGMLVSVELDYCDVYIFPVDPNMGPMEM